MDWAWYRTGLIQKDYLRIKTHEVITFFKNALFEKFKIKV